MQKAMITSVESMLEIEPNNERAQSLLAVCITTLADL